MSARDANQRFSTILGRAAEGEETIITRRGKPVARLVPYFVSPEQSGGWARLLAMLEAGFPLGGQKFTRDDLYDR